MYVTKQKKSDTRTDRERSRSLPAAQAADPRQHALQRHRLRSPLFQTRWLHSLQACGSYRLVHDKAAPIDGRESRLRPGIIAAAAVALTVAATAWPPPLLIVWNTTASVPIGLYVVARGTPQRGDLLVIHLPTPVEALAVARAILPLRTPVLKPVAAVAGDLVCRRGAVITINGRVAAIARRRDGHDNDLPVWQGCGRLSASHVFILAPHPDSFDSRYYGPLLLRLARGVARPLLTLPN